MIKIATIIVTYNAEKWIEKCISSLENASIQHDIFVVDNASTDDTLSILSRKRNIEIIPLKENYGFGYANNLALKEAIVLQYDYCFLINQDVFIEKETLSQLIEFAEKNASFGVVCPVQYNGKGKEIDYLFVDYIKKSNEKAEYYEATFVNAAAWLISKKCLQTVGLFNRLFRHYGEDVNYCNRVIFHGFKIGVLKNTRVLHDRNQSHSLEKAIMLAKIKLLGIFLNPNLSQLNSSLEAFKNVLGISKYIIKTYKNIKAIKIVPILILEYFRLILDIKNLSRNKDEFKIQFIKT